MDKKHQVIETMPDWTAPFKMPHVTTEEFMRRKAEYVAKHGYRYTIPGFDDIFHIPIEKPITEEEDALWKTGRKNELSAERREEIKYIKAKRKQRYLDMLGSPIPAVFQSRAALLTALDDTQDALSTLAVTGFAASRAVPPQARAIILAGSGWIMGAAQLLNMATKVLAPEQIGITRQKVMENMTTDNPFTKKARAKTAKRLKAGKFGVGALIEAAQVTDNVFGIGITLGAVMTLPFAIVYGAVKRATGHPVTVSWPVPHIPRWKRIAKKGLQAQGILSSVPEGTDDVEMTARLLMTNAAMQMELTDCEAYNPLDAVANPADAWSSPPAPTKGYLLEILEETDPDWEKTVTWPATGRKWENIDTLMNKTHSQATANFQAYAERQKHSELGFIGAQNACQSGMNAIEALEGPGSVEYDYTAPCKTFNALLNVGWLPPEGLTEDQKNQFTGWLDAHEAMGSCPTTPEALAYAEINCGWEFVRE